MRKLLAFFRWATAMPEGPPEVKHVFKGELVRVVDGDTLEVMVDRSFDDRSMMMVRLFGCDTPEARGPERPAGQWVTKQVEAFLQSRPKMVLDSVVYRRDMYGRALFRVWANDDELTAWLLTNGYAWPTDSEGKLIGPRNVELLRLPEGIKQLVREGMA